MSQARSLAELGETLDSALQFDHTCDLGPDELGPLLDVVEAAQEALDSFDRHGFPADIPPAHYGPLVPLRQALEALR